MDMFDPRYQPWTGGGIHFSFLNQPKAAERNFGMFCLALGPLLAADQTGRARLEKIKNDFSAVMQAHMIKMWASKLGWKTFDATLFNELMTLMIEISVDYTIFFRELSSIPEDITPLARSFYGDNIHDEALRNRWTQWLENGEALSMHRHPRPVKRSLRR